MNQDFYSVLGVPRTASQEEVKAAYRDKAKQFHPDRHHGSPETKKAETMAQFKAISEAYEVLGCAKKRSVYDIAGRTAARSGVASTSYANPGQYRYRTHAETNVSQYSQEFMQTIRRGLTWQNIVIHGALLGFSDIKEQVQARAAEAREARRAAFVSRRQERIQGEQ